jgi:predicted enzyme related to lactoylglutathione lyase
MAHVAHFAINADDVSRARRFYEKVFGWKLEPWGPPNFYLINTRDQEANAVMGALQARRELIPGKRTIGFECTISVKSLDETIAAIEANGGKIVLSRSTIVGVGDLVFVEDTEGNVAGAMQYDKKAE